MKQLAQIILLFAFTGQVSAQESAARWKNYTEEALSFSNGKDTIYGKLILPNKSFDKLPVIVFVHGSGPEDYSSSDIYRPLWEKFTEEGFACFSWNKPGIGLSQGNWFEQSIEQRAEEVVNAILRLKRHPKINHEQIGLWGISQAGWVIPKVAEVIPPAFVISVSSPVTTAFDQEVYRLESELTKEGYTSTAIDSAITYTRNVRDLILEGKPFAEFDSVQQMVKNHDWFSYVIAGGESIYQYLGVIIKDDHIPNLSSLNCPILAIWGENDLLVPPSTSANRYTEVMKQIGNGQARIVIVPNADHTLTYNNSGRRKETMERREEYADEPEEIFAPGYLDIMAGWLEDPGHGSKGH